MKCFFWCLEKFLKFLNKNAYIEVRVLQPLGLQIVNRQLCERNKIQGLVIMFMKAQKIALSWFRFYPFYLRIAYVLLCCMVSLITTFSFAFLSIIFTFFFQIAVYGKNFCTSAKNAFFLLMRNILRYVTFIYFSFGSKLYFILENKIVKDM